LGDVYLTLGYSEIQAKALIKDVVKVVLEMVQTGLMQAKIN